MVKSILYKLYCLCDWDCRWKVWNFLKQSQNKNHLFKICVIDGQGCYQFKLNFRFWNQISWNMLFETDFSLAEEYLTIFLQHAVQWQFCFGLGNTFIFIQFPQFALTSKLWICKTHNNTSLKSNSRIFLFCLYDMI